MKMKVIFVLCLSFIFSLSIPAFSSSTNYNQDPNAPENKKPGANINTGGNNTASDIDNYKKMQIGFYAGVGLSRQTSAHFTQGEIYTNLSLQFSVVFDYFVMKNFGIELELGWQNYKTGEKDSVTKNELNYSLQYLFLSVAPILQFSNIYFSFGVYFGFILPGTDLTGSESYSNEPGDYNIPDFGFKLSAGYKFNLSKKIQMFAGINFRAQVFNFRKYNASGSKIVAFYANIGMLFDL